MSFTYFVRVNRGNDRANNVLAIDAESHEDAAREAEMRFLTDTVTLVNVEMGDGSCFTDLCENPDHWCPACRQHLDLDGWCFNCHI